MDGQVRLQVSDEDADGAWLAELTSYLRSELLDLNVENVTVLSDSPPPPGARAVDVAAIGALIVTLGQSADALQSVISLASSWLQRSARPSRMVRVEIGGDVLELSQASTAEQEQLVQLYIDRHSVN
jgi:hypothetical protein